MKKIILTENQFAKNILLNEYKGEQLVIPFDGDSDSYNYMQYIDYLQQNSVGKTLTTKYKTPQEYIDTLEKPYLIWLARCYFNEVQSYEDSGGFFENDGAVDELKKLIHNWNEIYGIDFNENIEKSDVRGLIHNSKNPELAIDIFSNFMKYVLRKIFKILLITKDGLIYVERAVQIPQIFNHSFKNDSGFDEELFYHLNSTYLGNVGVCWSFGVNNSDAYYGHKVYTNDIKNTIILKGFTRFEDVDIIATVSLYFMNERELRLKKDGLVKITNMELQKNTDENDPYSEYKYIGIKANYPFVVRA